MLKVGVLEEAVRIKMKTEGLDPNLISTPDAPPPDQPQSSDENDDSDSD
jgi:WASH complex subunit CCDC53